MLGLNSLNSPYAFKEYDPVSSNQINHTQQISLKLTKAYFTTIETSRGDCNILGATPCKDGVNFAIHSTSKTMNLRLYEDVKNKPICTIKLNSTINKTGNVWHTFIKDLVV